jgi:protein MAK16
MKTVERSHLPAQLWEKVRLPNNYKQGIDVLEIHLQYFPEAYKQKCQQRLKRLFQYLTKVRKLKLHDKAGELLVYKQKTERREARREKKAEQVARLDQSIEKELVARLKSGLYQDIYNVSQSHFESILKKDMHADSEHEEDVSFDEFVEMDEELQVEDDFEEDEVEEFEEDEQQFVESEDDIEDSQASLPQKRARRGEAYVRIEYEQEEEPDARLKQRL